jgi:cytochrome oxidase Cu insertion factor (SCO1/SenC/PrrC family)
MKLQRNLLLLVCTGLLLAGGSVSADTLLKARAAKAKAATLPAGGVTMSEVEGQYGQPTERKDPVGKPPITRWIYPAFTVYFENDRVISAVLNKASELEEGPKPAPPQKPHR